MKNIFLFLLCTLACITLNAQNKKSCCTANNTTTEKASATASFASLGKDQDFVKSHEEPTPYTHTTANGKMVTFKTPDGKTAKAFVFKAKQPTDKYLFVFHEWWGLNDYVKREAEKYYNDLQNVTVMAIDLYDGKIATTREEAQKYMQEVDQARAESIIKGALQHAGKDANIATVGWCFGGGWSLQAAILANDKAEACVMYYGMPENNVERLKKLNCPVLGIFAEQDGWITPKVVEDFQANMKEANEELTVKMYNAQHAFANPSNPQYDKEATQDAYQLSLNFIKKTLD